MSTTQNDPRKMALDIEAAMRGRRDDPGPLGQLGPSVLDRLAAHIMETNRGRRRRAADDSDNFVTISGNHFFFYKPATVVRLPDRAGEATKPDLVIRIRRDAPSAGVALRASEFGLDEGFYIMDDGSVVILVPSDGKTIDLLVEGDKGPITDDGLNYKC